MSAFWWIVAGYFGVGFAWLGFTLLWVRRRIGFAAARTGTDTVAARNGLSRRWVIWAVVLASLLAWPWVVWVFVKQGRRARREFEAKMAAIGERE